MSGTHSVTLQIESTTQQSFATIGDVSSYVYILASKRNGTLYTGVTADLSRRVYEHKQRLTRGFTEKYGAIRLVWYRHYDYVGDAIADEKRIKKWRRAWKIRMIEEMNPDWRELYDEIAW